MKVLAQVAAWTWRPIDLLLRGVFSVMRLTFGVCSLGFIDLRYAHKEHRFELIFMGLLSAFWICVLLFAIGFHADVPWKPIALMLGLVLICLAPWAAMLNDYVLLCRREAEEARALTKRETLREARERLRANFHGVICAAGKFEPIRLVVASNGTLVSAWTKGNMYRMDATVLLPGEDEEVLQLHVSVLKEDDAHSKAAACARLRDYHGDTDESHVTQLSINRGWFRGHSLDGSELMVPNLLATSEAEICQELNDPLNKFALFNAAAAAARREVTDPRVVGVDPLGIDLRCGQELFRLASTDKIDDVEDAVVALELFDEMRDEDSDAEDVEDET